ncbi:putative Agglutinin domain-containing protein [Rosa chinensis]|uniref:Putative Agglutinin domain-containing protein n=1 Tax=Rosa chinensis TaxID=74649 RepID=A0A2P6R8R3_ROSCH|nr:putative Agglutinin domain-containing protein [Rosa chinensis]
MSSLQWRRQSTGNGLVHIRCCYNNEYRRKFKPHAHCSRLSKQMMMRNPTPPCPPSLIPITRISPQSQPTGHPW